MLVGLETYFRIDDIIIKKIALAIIKQAWNIDNMPTVRRVSPPTIVTIAVIIVLIGHRAAKTKVIISSKQRYRGILRFESLNTVLIHFGGTI